MPVPRRKTRVTYEGLSFLMILAFIVLGSILRQINLLVLLSGLMIAPFFFNWRLSRKMLERLRFSRRIPVWVHAGTSFPVLWQVENQRRTVPAWGIRIDDSMGCARQGPAGARQSEPVTAGAIVHQIDPLQKATAQYHCRIARRGIYEFGPGVASSAFPVGLVRTRIELPEVQSLIVAPREVRLRQNWLASIRGTARLPMTASSHRNGMSNEDFYSLRSWQSGDSRRLIHWRSSAKRGELQVRQGTEPDALQTIVVFDFGISSRDQREAEVTEVLASIATTIVNQSFATRGPGKLVVAICGDPCSGHPVEPGPRSLPLLLECLARVKAANRSGVFDTVQSLARRRSAANQIVVLSIRDHDAARTAELPAGGHRSPQPSLRNLKWVNVAVENLIEGSFADAASGAQFAMPDPPPAREAMAPDP
jgi:uncharacterized protein (DUF58 family)